MRGLDQRVFEILVEEFDDAHGVEAHGVVHDALAELPELPAEVQQFQQVTRLERGRVRCGAQQELADEAALPHDVAPVAHFCVRVAGAVPSHFAARGVGVDIAAEIIPVLGEGDAAAVGDHLQAVAGQIQRPVHFRAQQAAHIRAVGIDPVLVEVTTDRGAADIRVLFHHQHAQPGLGQEGRVGEAVVPGADHDCIVLLSHARSLFAQALTAFRLSWSRVQSTARSNAPRVRCRLSPLACASHRNHGSRESGSHSTPWSWSTGASAS